MSVCFVTNLSLSNRGHFVRLFLKSKNLFFLLIFGCCFFDLAAQNHNVKTQEIEYGVRLLHTSRILHREVAYLEEDFGVHFVDGFFVRIRKTKKSYRTGLGYYSNGFAVPHYEKTPKGLIYTRTDYLQFFGGIQLFPVKQKLFYMFLDITYSKTKKEGYVLGANGPLYLINSFRQNAGFAPGAGLQFQIHRWAFVSFEYDIAVLWQQSRATETLPYGNKEVFYHEEKTGIKCPAAAQIFFTLKF